MSRAAHRVGCWRNEEEATRARAEEAAEAKELERRLGDGARRALEDARAELRQEAAAVCARAKSDLEALCAESARAAEEERERGASEVSAAHRELIADASAWQSEEGGLEAAARALAEEL